MIRHERSAREPAASDRRAYTLRTTRIAAFAPVVVLGMAVLLASGAGPVQTTFGIVVLVGVVLVGAATPPPSVTTGVGTPEVTPAVLGASGVLVSVVVLVAALDGDPQRFTLVFGVVVVATAFALPRRQRGPLILWAFAGWAASLWFGGVRDATVVATQIGGALLIALVALRTTSALETALRIERAASRASRTRASLLASVLRLQSLEPQAIAEAVVTGVREAGLDDAVLRAVDGRELRTIAVRTAEGITPPPPVISVDDGLAGIACRSGRVEVVDDYGAHPAALPGSGDLRGMVAAPVHVDGELTAVLIGARRAVGLTSVQREAVELLAEEAGVAFGRARRFATDAATVTELRRLDERTHDFVSTVSHELRTPMTVVTGLGQTLARRWDDLEGGRRADLLRRIDENAERLAAMVRSLVDTSALERGQLVVRAEPVDLATSVGRVLGRLGPLLEGHRTGVEVPDGTWVVADPSLLEHVVENLLSNAARHTPPGTTVDVRVRVLDGEVELEVVDDGPGIDPADLPHVLERFYRAGEPTTRPSGGLGLGLAISQQVLRAHGRDLTVASVPGEGTRFAFRLPAHRPGQVPDAVTATGR
jgi:signal transduction histidine kinase